MWMVFVVAVRHMVAGVVLCVLFSDWNPRTASRSLGVSLFPMVQAQESDDAMINKRGKFEILNGRLDRNPWDYHIVYLYKLRFLWNLS